ncbi:MAG: hypothetical protein RLZZ543_921 [Bacteroidota bacterium]|jgi:uncharacterized protein YegL
MRFNSFLFLFLLIGVQLCAQKPEAEPRQLDFGNVDQASILQSYLVIRNTGNKTLMLLRAEAPREFSISVGKKMIPAGDTVHLRFSIRPSVAGRFKENIQLYYNSSPEPYSITVKGDLKKLLSRDLAACVNFDPKTGNASPGAVIPLLTQHRTRFLDAKTSQPILQTNILYVSQLTREKAERSTTSGMLETTVPIGPYTLVITAAGYETLMIEKYIPYNVSTETFLLHPLKLPPTPKPDSLQPEVVQVKPPILDPAIGPPLPLETTRGELDEKIYRPNNVVFLIDVSGSMKEPDKLPLLKRSLARLMEPVRAIDKISIVTYGTEARIAVPTVSGAEKKQVLSLIDTLQAGGVTAGSKGLQMAYGIAKEQFIAGGNNQIILATDGAFRVSGKDRKMIQQSANDTTQNLRLTIVGFGDDEAALNMLGDLSKLGGGSMIQVKNASEAEHALLDEIKQRSKK